jgi:serine/threonine-protein kinase
MAEEQACPDAAQWQALLTGALPEQRQAELAGHLDTCVTCRQTLEGLAAEGQAWSQAARQMAPDPAASEKALQHAMAALKDDPGRTQTLPGSAASGRNGLDFLSPSDQPGHLGRLGPYEILEEIGRGGMGIVLKAFDPTLHRLVAVKVLAPYLAARADARQRFLREARAAAAVVHDHVVTIHAVDEANGLPYLVMEYVRAVSLQDRLDAGPPPDLKEIVRIGAQTAVGLAAAHAQGLVHRDIKPANILLENTNGRVKITDFGLARAAADAAPAAGEAAGAPTAGLTQVGTVTGTPPYMAPEQARGQTVDHRADLFSLGSVLYALCTGRAPFQGDTVQAILDQVCRENPPPVRKLNRKVPRWLADVIDRLHAKDPAERFQAAAEVAELLDQRFTHLHLRLGYEYRSRRTWWGLPLVHVASGVDPRTGRRRMARGIIAIGERAVGVVALGGTAIGVLALGGAAIGVIALGGGAIGLLLAVGGGAVGGIALGGAAIGGVALGGGALGYYAFGGSALGAHPLGDNAQDPQAVEFFRHWLGSWIDGRLRQP